MANLIILILTSAAAVMLWIYCYPEHARRASAKEKALYLPSFLFWLGIVDCGLFLVFGWIAACQDGSLGLTICFCTFALMGMVLMIGWKNCYVIYDKTGFTQKNIIGMQRSFSYSQVTSWYLNKRNPIECTLYALDKKISFNLLSKNGADFLVSLSDGYRKTHSNMPIPEKRQTKKTTGFSAHVHNAGEYLAIFVMLSAFVVGTGLWIIIDGLQPIDEHDGKHYTLTFSSWEIQEDSLILTNAQMQEPFRISGYAEHMSNFDQLIEACDGSKTFSVWARRLDPDDEEPYFRVYALSSSENVYRTFEDSTADKRESLPFTIGIYSIFLAVLLLFSAIYYLVGSYPQKFPKWIVNCLFSKDGIDF